MTFGRLGRAFLVAAGVTLVAAVICVVVLDGSTRAVVAGILGLLALLAFIQGVVWTAVQHRMFGSIASLRRTAATGRPTTATIVAVQTTSSQIGADPIVRLDLMIDGHRVTRRVRVPLLYVAEVRVERQLPVRTDPDGSHAMIVDWERLG